jgi:hypothetical protein
VTEDSIIVDNQQPDVELTNEPTVEIHPYMVETNSFTSYIVEKAPFPPYPLPIKVPEIPEVPAVPRKKNELNITKVTTITLLTFDIRIIRVSPGCCCSVDIVINTTAGPQDRTVNLTGEDYTKWGCSDDYIYYYVRDNIDKIY